MKVVSIRLPKNMEAFKKRYAEVIAEAITDSISHQGLGYLIERLEEKEVSKNS